MADPYRAFRQLERQFRLRDIAEPASSMLNPNSKWTLICTIVYDRDKQTIEYVYANPESQNK